jgi:hypothetical protein
MCVSAVRGSLCAFDRVDEMARERSASHNDRGTCRRSLDDSRAAE